MKKLLRNTLTAMAVATCAIPVMAQKYVGGDISLLPTYEEHGVRYLDSKGNQVSDPLKYWGDSAQWNAMRVRLFVDPSKASSEDQGEGVHQDLDYVTKLGKRIKDAGYSFMLDFHYSDTWTDPGQHSTPSSWNSNDPAVLADSVYAYTKRCLQHLVSSGATPDFIQPGNEVTYGMMWPTGYCYPDGSNGNDSKIGQGSWSNFASYLKAGIKACKEVCPDAKIVLHTEMSHPSQVVSFYNTADKNNIDYDIIALSYYPDYHGKLSTLASTLTSLESQHPSKQIMIVETGYEAQWQLEDATYTASQLGWSVTEAGQKQFTDDLITELNKHSSVTGLFWWLPEDNEYWADKNQARTSWWNASLYIQNTGKPTAAMFELKNFTTSTTGITTLKQDRKVVDDAYYNLSGQRVNRPHQGLYIHNDKKVIIK